ncbi:androgen-induced gene 1 protein-like isoform X2 [Zootermopsis nevadensis]|uniref:androgen-induced gene 1 protein-like isoform X2 n=1 Tax=Zootermopsis nevadensis TaxID=136037 RepID=UPI000B8EC86C|nr:androgen-induced gene 1 protein-like isoform X2 [Zootermopsis nevadensis]
MLRQIFFLIAVSHFYYGIYYDLSFVTFPPAFHRGGFFDSISRFKYLTFWNMILQSVYFTICLLNDIIGSNEISIKEKPLIRKIKDYMFASVAFPVAMFVGVTFWGLMAIDRELVFPKALDPFFPSWLNHVMHTNIVIFTLLEMVSSFRTYPKRSTGLTGLLAFMVIYLIWVHVIFSKSGVWVYPVLDVLNWWQRIIFYLVSLSLQASLYIVGETLNKAKWGKVQKELEGSKRRKIK